MLLTGLRHFKYPDIMITCLTSADIFQSLSYQYLNASSSVLRLVSKSNAVAFGLETSRRTELDACIKYLAYLRRNGRARIGWKRSQIRLR